MVGCSENHPVEFASQSQRQPATANVTGHRTSIPFGHHAISKTFAQFVHIYHTDRVFDGLKIVFAEIDKYKKLAVKGDSKKDLWMRYFTEMTAETRTPAPELIADPDIAKAVKLLEVINYNKAEEYLYDRYWDGVSVEATRKGIGRDEGLSQGLKQGREEGLQQGLQQGLQKGRDEGLQQGHDEERRNLAAHRARHGFR